MKIAFYLPDGGRYSKNIVTFSQFNSKSEEAIFLQNDNTMMGKKAYKYTKEKKKYSD